MAFNPQMDIPDDALQDFKNFEQLLETKYPVKKGALNRIYMHCSFAPNGMKYSDYNVMTLLNGKLTVSITGNPQDNVPGLTDNAIHPHTFHRNEGAVGISIDGMEDAKTDDFGSNAHSQLELLYLCGCVAATAKAYDIDISGVVKKGKTHLDKDGGTVNTKGENNALTHAECAVIDLYPNERWDLGILEAIAKGKSLTPKMRTTSGNILRECAHRIKLLL